MWLLIISGRKPSRQHWKCIVDRILCWWVVGRVPAKPRHGLLAGMNMIHVVTSLYVETRSKTVDVAQTNCLIKKCRFFGVKLSHEQTLTCTGPAVCCHCWDNISCWYHIMSCWCISIEDRAPKYGMPYLQMWFTSLDKVQQSKYRRLLIVHLAYLPLVPHICVSASGQPWFR